MSLPQQPLSSLSQTHLHVDQPSYNAGGFSGAAGFILLWILLFCFVFILIFATQPTWVRVPGTTQVNTATVLWASVIISLLVIIVLWVLKAFIGGGGGMRC